jgi:nucleoside-diphosphate-sugar epimerase
MLRRGWALDPAQANVVFVFQTRVPHPYDILWDLLDPVPAALHAAGPFDAMIALAGVVPRGGADLTLNTALGAGAVRAAAVLGIPAVLLASSSAVYGTALERGYREDDTPAPLNAYGAAKLEMERACARLALEASVACCALRIGNVAGADALLLNGAALRDGAALKLDRFADGLTPLRSYIGPLTLGDVLLTLVRAGIALPPCLNIAAPVPVHMAALAQAADFPVDLVAAQGRAHQNVTLDCGALAQVHPFAAEESSAAEMIAQWRRVADPQGMA